MNPKTSPAKVQSNRRNALKSTGPRTKQGKETVKWNALKHGLLSREIVIRVGDGEESGTEFSNLHRALRDDLQPVGTLEEMLVEKIAVCYWRLRRVLRCEIGEIRKNTDDLAFRTLLNRIDDVRNAKGLSYMEPTMHRLVKSTTGLDRLVSILDDLREEVEEDGHFSEQALKDLQETFGSERGTFGHTAVFFHWVATKDNSGESESDLPSPEKCKTALLSLIDHEKVRFRTMREAIAEQEEMTQSAMLSSYSLPPSDATERILRYETAIERQLYRAIDQLDRLRRQRRGEQPTPTINVDL